MEVVYTIIILFIAAMYLIYIIQAINHSEHEIIKEAGFIPLILTIILAGAFIISSWTDFTKTTNQFVIPTIKVTQEIVNNSIIKSDTTYTYTFKK